MSVLLCSAPTSNARHLHPFVFPYCGTVLRLPWQACQSVSDVHGSRGRNDRYCVRDFDDTVSGRLLGALERCECNIEEESWQEPGSNGGRDQSG